MNKEEQLDKKFEEIESSIPQERAPISFEKLQEVITKWLLIEDTNITKVVAGAIIANRLSGDPVWLFIVAPSGGTKTEFIRGLDNIAGVYPISDLTAQTFISGQKGMEASLLFRLPENPILTYKDFTTVLTMHFDKKHAILSQLREIYDGSYRKEFGTGESKQWKGKLGFIAGVTSIIDHHAVVYSVLGERFVQYRPLQPDAIRLSKRAMKNSGKETEMREEIQNAFADYIAGIQIPTEKFALPDDLQDRIANLAALCVRARSGVLRDGYSSREIELIPQPEVPTRFSKTLMQLGAAFHVMGGMQFTEDDYNLLCKIGLDSIPMKRKLILELLAAQDTHMETADIATKIGYPTNTTRRELENLHGLQVLERIHQGQGTADKWLITELARSFIMRALPAMMPDQVETQPETVPEKSEDPFEGMF